MASGDRGTASDSSNIGSTVGSLVGGAIGSVAGPVGAVPCAALGASIGGAIAGTGKQINIYYRKLLTKSCWMNKFQLQVITNNEPAYYLSNTLKNVAFNLNTCSL
jgi:phage tail tape-measure protein